MVRYLAVFPDGTVLKRGTKREYGAAWRVLASGVKTKWAGQSEKAAESGFAGTIELATKAAAAIASRWRGYGWTIDTVEIVPTQEAK